MNFAKRDNKLTPYGPKKGANNTKMASLDE
jgi:hypothetical protein